MVRTQRKLSGFTFVELVIAILIMGILSAAAAPRYLDAISRFRVESASRRIVADLKLAQREARRTSSSQTVVYDVGQNRYELPGVDDLDHPGVAYHFDLGQVDSLATIVSASIGGGTTVNFDMYGHSNASGTVVIRSGGYTKTIGIDTNGSITQTGTSPVQ